MNSTYKFVFTIIIEIVTFSLAIYGIIKYNTYLVFWIAAVIEVAVGLLAEKVEKLQPTDDYNRWSLYTLSIVFFASGIPIALSYAIDSLESIRGTWLFFLLVLNSFGLYKFIKKERI